ncbi:MAG: rhodanese-like domain-containing protein [Chitinophagaceae bacterium]|nr:rhodanese-like domain-containing protein [Chitinophagaceae bacterium]MCW5906215.1 rhodanese-like domain-containing protein [Chitinophagaceae bacterium]
MKRIMLSIFSLLIMSNVLLAQTKQEPWNSQQLLDPAILAKKINQNQTKNMLIYCIGPDAIIKGSINIGAGENAANIKKLKEQLKNVSKDKEVVIYCGCCPFDRCPNVRPAFKALKEMGFKNAKLLNLSNNIKTNWIDKNYPMND